MSKRGAPPPPSHASPISKDVVEIVRKKIAPKGPPPDEFRNFKVPKGYNAESSNNHPKYAANLDDEMGSVEEESHHQYHENPGNVPFNKETLQQHNRDHKSEGDNIWHKGKRQGDEETHGMTAADAKGTQRPELAPEKGRQQSHGNVPPSYVQEKADAKDQQFGIIDLSPFYNQGRPSTAAGKYPLVIFHYTPVLKATYRELKHFVNSPCIPGVVVRCYVERNRSGTNAFAPFYSLCADLEDGTGRELMVCKKVLASRSAHYIFSLKADDLYRKREQRSRLYLGKLRGVSNTEYVLYDDGICQPEDAAEDEVDSGEKGDGVGGDDDETEPADSPRNSGVRLSGSSGSGGGAPAKAEAKEAGAAGDTGASRRNSGSSFTGTGDVSLYRKELCVISVNARRRPTQNDLRGLEVGVYPPEEARTHGASLLSHFRKVQSCGQQNALLSKKVMFLHEKASRYDPLSAVIVEFKDRANLASVKNFQLVRSGPHGSNLKPGDDGYGSSQVEKDAMSEVILQLGKTTEDCFNLDFKYPLSMLQAFAVAIARFDAKVSWSL